MTYEQFNLFTNVSNFIYIDFFRSPYFCLNVFNVVCCAHIVLYVGKSLYISPYLCCSHFRIRPISPLRRYEMTMGHEEKEMFGNQFILAKKNASFLALWHQSYKNYKTGNWVWNSLITPFKLSREHPELIHVDGFNFTRPNYGQTKLIFKENYDWSTNYAMHLFIRVYKDPIDVKIMRTLNTTIGAISRYVFFGNKELCWH